MSDVLMLLLIHTFCTVTRKSRRLHACITITISPPWNRTQSENTNTLALSLNEIQTLGHKLHITERFIRPPNDAQIKPYTIYIHICTTHEHKHTRNAHTHKRSRLSSVCVVRITFTAYLHTLTAAKVRASSGAPYSKETHYRNRLSAHTCAGMRAYARASTRPANSAFNALRSRACVLCDMRSRGAR